MAAKKTELESGLEIVEEPSAANAPRGQIHRIYDLAGMRPHRPHHLCWCSPELEDFEPTLGTSTWRHRTYQ